MDRCTYGCELETGRDNAVTTCLKRAPGARQNQLTHIALEAEIIEIPAIQDGRMFPVDLGDYGLTPDLPKALDYCHQLKTEFDALALFLTDYELLTVGAEQ